MISQCVILCGGLGQRLGELTSTTPKPLLGVAGVPFLDILIEEVARQGFDRILLLAGHLATSLESYAMHSAPVKRRTIRIDVSIEPRRAGTGGALLFAEDGLDDQFLLLNGDSWLDCNIRALCAVAENNQTDVITLALRPVEDGSRYGSVVLEGDRIVCFREKSGNAARGLINGGIYVCRKEPLLDLVKTCGAGGSGEVSLESEIMPILASRNQLGGMECSGYFIDIGLPDTYRAAQTEIPVRRRRPAAFFDRDGVLNVNFGHVGTIDRFKWIDGAIAAVRACNDLGFFVFVVTNQAGVAKGMYHDEDVWALHNHIQQDLAKHGAYVDDFRYCPYHVDAVVARYRRDSNWRKPRPGMLLDLLHNWDVDVEKSFMIGDTEGDSVAAAAASVNGYMFRTGNLHSFLSEVPMFVARRKAVGGKTSASIDRIDLGFDDKRINS